MLPLTAKLQVNRWRLWLPLFLLWVLALPLALIAMPILLLVKGSQAIDVARALLALICSCRGLTIEIEDKKSIFKFIIHQKGHSMTEHRTKILSMLATGKINVEEADRLLTAIKEEKEPTLSTTEQKSAEFFHLQVDGETRVNIKVPFRLIRAGIKLRTLIPQNSQDKMKEAMEAKGVHFDWSALESENVDELVQMLQELELSVDDAKSGETVRIYCA